MRCVSSQQQRAGKNTSRTRILVLLYLLFTMCTDSIDSEWILILCNIEDCTIHPWFLTHRTQVVIIFIQTLVPLASLVFAVRIEDQFSKVRALELGFIAAHPAVLLKICI